VTTSSTRGSRDVADEVVLGVDTHLDFHVAVVLEHLGRRLGESKILTTLTGATATSSVGRKDSAP
jgi:hypothetical protein